MHYHSVLLLLCMNSLYSVDISPLLDMWFANIFSHGLPFILLMVADTI